MAHESRIIFNLTDRAIEIESVDGSTEQGVIDWISDEFEYLTGKLPTANGKYGATFFYNDTSDYTACGYEGDSVTDIYNIYQLSK